LHYFEKIHIDGNGDRDSGIGRNWNGNKVSSLEWAEMGTVEVIPADLNLEAT